MEIIKKGNKYKKKGWIASNKEIFIAIIIGILFLTLETWALGTIFGLF